MVAELKRLVPIDPTHLPGEIALVEAFDRHLPSVPQVACFDTAFHRELPRVAWLLPIPRRYADQGVRRYGFHGLSFTYLLAELTRLDPAAAAGRVILAHLGSGASMAAVFGGHAIDTTMSFTPAAGLVMGTRTGDIDAGVLTYLMRTEGLNADQLDDLVNHQSGLLGLSETSSDMRDLLERRQADSRAADAVAAFLLPGAQVGWCPRCGTRWSGYPGFQRRHWRKRSTRAGGDLPGARASRHPLRRSPQRAGRQRDFRARQPVQRAVDSYQ